MRNSPSRIPAVRALEIVRNDRPVRDSVPRSYWRRLSRAIAVLMAAIAAHVWLVRAPQSPAPAGRPIEMAQFVPTPAPPVSRDVQVTVDLITVPVASPIGTSGQDHAAGALRTAVGRSNAPSRSVGELIGVGATEFLTERSEEREPVPTPAGARAADMPETEETPVDTVQVKLLKLQSDSPRILAALPLSVAPAALPARPVTEPSTSYPARVVQEQTEIREVLNRYTRALEGMDLRATKAVYPSVDDRALERAYRGLDGQQVRLSGCGVSIDGSDANARCRASATYRQKVGSRTVHLTDVEWMFSLARGDAGWQIVNARIR